MTILVVGGTQAAVEIASRLAQTHRVVYSLAGITQRPNLPDGATIHRGGFGGADAMAKWLTDTNISAVVLAAHPFAERIAAQTTEACDMAGLHLSVLEAGQWTHQARDQWRWCGNIIELGAAINSFKPRAVFLALGRRSAAQLPPLDAVHRCILRIAEPIEASAQQRDTFSGPSASGSFKIIAAKGPFSEASERKLFREEGIDLLVCKDSGLASGIARLDAANALGIPVFMLKRPDLPATWRHSPMIQRFFESDPLISAIDEQNKNLEHVG